jgi:hypothetical protein
VITDPDFPAPVLFALDFAQASKKHAIAPGGRTLLLAGIVVIRANVVLIRWRESDGRFGESAQAEARVLLAGEQKLVALE